MNLILHGLDILLDRLFSFQDLQNAICRVFDMKEDEIFICDLNKLTPDLEETIRILVKVSVYKNVHEYKIMISMYLRDHSLEVETSHEAIELLSRLCGLLNCRMIIDDILTKPYDYGWLVIEKDNQYKKVSFSINEYDNDPVRGE